MILLHEIITVEVTRPLERQVSADVGILYLLYFKAVTGQCKVKTLFRTFIKPMKHER